MQNHDAQDQITVSKMEEEKSAAQQTTEEIKYGT